MALHSTQGQEVPSSVVATQTPSALRQVEEHNATLVGIVQSMGKDTRTAIDQQFQLLGQQLDAALARFVATHELRLNTLETQLDLAFQFCLVVGILLGLGFLGCMIVLQQALRHVPIRAFHRPARAAMQTAPQLILEPAPQLQAALDRLEQKLLHLEAALPQLKQLPHPA